MSLTRGRVAALAVAIVTVAGVGVLVGQFASGWWRGTGGSYAPATLVATSTITPQSSLFADPLSAEIDVVVNPRRIDPASVVLTPSFAPFAIRSQSQSVGRHVDAGTAIRYRYEIQCLTAACVPLLGKRVHDATEATPIRLEPTTLTARGRDGKTITQSVAWPPITMHSRLTADEAALSTPHIAPWFTPPPVSWLLTPDLAGGIALTLAVLMLLGAGSLVATVVSGDATQLRVRRLPHLSPVERALRLAEHAAAGGEVDEERKALERLAEELARSGHDDLAGRARSLAWSQGDPAEGGLATLAETVRSNGAR